MFLEKIPIRRRTNYRVSEKSPYPKQFLYIILSFFGGTVTSRTVCIDHCIISIHIISVPLYHHSRYELYREWKEMKSFELTSDLLVRLFPLFFFVCVLRFSFNSQP